MDAETIWQIKKDMCEIGRRIWLKGFCAANEGNHSVRIGPDRLLCTPTGISKGFMEPDDMCLVDMDGKQVEQNPRGRERSSEVRIHIGIMEKRSDIKAVVHSHPPHATAFAVANIPLPSGLHPEKEFFLGVVPLAPYATPSKWELAESITNVLTPETYAVLMGNHGAVSFSKSLIDAYYKHEILDAHCRILLLCKELGKANVLDHAQMTELLQVKADAGYPDERLACAPQGCYEQNNDAFFSQFETRTPSAMCDCNGGPVRKSLPAQLPGKSDTFETMVHAITEQIMRSVR